MTQQSRNVQRAMEAESSVIGGLLADNSAIRRVTLAPDDFMTQTWRRCFEAISTLLSERRPADFLTVTDFLSGAYPNTPWLADVAEALKNLPPSRNVEAYAEIVRRESIRRQAQAIANELYEQTEADAPEAADNAIRSLMQLSSVKRNYECSLPAAVSKALEAIDKAVEMGGGIIGIPSGLTALDESLGGFRGGDLVVVAARPAMGKTAFLLNMALAANRAVGVISAEQGSDQVGARAIAIRGSVSSHRMRVGKLEDNDYDRITMSVNALNSHKMRINDQPGISIAELIRQARVWKFENDIEALYVDYLQRIKPHDSRAPRHEQVAGITESLKELARELGIPVIVLAQVNRNIESRGDKRPGMGDIAESSAIEKEADQIMTLYRDEVYNPETMEKGVAEIGLLKNRHGPIGRIRCIFRSEFMQFKDADARALALSGPDMRGLEFHGRDYEPN